jgi:putative PEP-CTERM system TPR-repeat lipoprotein
MNRIGFILAASIAAATTCAPSFAADRQESEKYLSEAKASLAKQDFKAALVELRNAVQADPDNAAARYELGVLQLRAGDAASAEKELRAARNLGYPEAETIVPLAEAYLSQEKYELVLSEVVRGYRPPETETEIRVARGLALLGLERFPEAQAAFEDALTMTQKPARALISLARVKGVQGDAEGARRDVARALEANPKFVEAWVLQGQIKRFAGELDAARLDYDKALEIEPKSVSARIARAELLVTQGNIALGESDVGAVLQVQSANGRALYLQALIQGRQRKYREAELSLQKLGRRLTSYPPAVYLLAQLNAAQNQLAQAEDNVNRYIALAPGDPNGVALLGTVLLRRGNVARAVDVLNAAVEKQPRNARLLALLSQAYQRNNQRDESAKTLDRIAALAAGDAEILTALASRRLRMGRPEDAVYDLEAAMSVDAKSPQAKPLLVMGYLGENKVDEALKAATEFRDEQPDSAAAENLLGVVSYRKLGLAAAKEHFENAVRLKPDFIMAKVNLVQIAILEKQPDRARQLYDEILLLDPNYQTALLGQAELSRSEGKLGDAVRWLEKARNANPKSAAPRITLINTYLARRDSAKAVEVARELAGVANDDAAAMRAVGHAFTAGNDVAAAVAALQQVVKLEPASALSHYELASAYSMARDTSNARVELEKSLELDPASIEVQKSYVQFMVASKDVEPALTFARRLGAARPTETAPNLLQGDLLAATRRREEAVTAYEQGVAKGESRLLIERIAAVETERGNLLKAVQTYDNWLAKHPEDATSRSQLAGLLMKQGQDDRALTEYEHVLKAQPDDPLILNNLAWLYAKKGDPRGLATAEKAYQLAPQSPMISDTFGWILLRRGEGQRALPILEQAATRAPGRGDIQYHYAAALNEAGRRDVARQILEKLLKSGEKSSEMDEARKLLDQIKSGK